MATSGDDEWEGSACAGARLAASARLDGEDPGPGAPEADAHVRGCPACQAWLARARIPLVADPVPDLTAAVMASIEPGETPTGTPAVAGRRRRARRPAPRWRTAGIAAAVVVVAGAAGVGAAELVHRGGPAPLVSTQQVEGSSQSDSRYPGAAVLPISIPKPHLVLTDTSGQPFDLATQTAGKVTLLYFGYTHCPDVCPINMALAAEAIARMPPAEAKDVDVVFVSTDPKRDTPAVIRAWLDNFSPRFIGLTGSIDQVEAAEQAVGMARSVAVAGGPSSDGGYQIVHSGFTLVYDQQGISRLQFYDTARPAQYATTLEHVVTGGVQV